MTPRPIAEAPRDGRVIVGLRRRGNSLKYWHGGTMFWTRPYLDECWVYTGFVQGVVPEGCQPTHFLSVEGANDE